MRAELRELALYALETGARGILIKFTFHAGTEVMGNLQGSWTYRLVWKGDGKVERRLDSRIGAGLRGSRSNVEYHDLKGRGEVGEERNLCIRNFMEEEIIAEMLLI